MSESTLILIVEDNPSNRLLAAAVLQREGFQVDCAATSGEAMERVSRRPPAVILMDVQLPGGDGLALARQFKADPVTALIPIVAVTANAMNGDRELTLAAGCNGYISKPIDTRTFGELVRTFILQAKV